MSVWGSSAGARRPLQFVTPVPPPPPPPPPPAEDDDVWGEELPEEALQEAILLESQQYTEPASRAPAAAHRDQQQRRPPVAAVAAAPADNAEPLSELQRLRRDNRALTEQLQTARSDRYSHQGEVSVLREELTRRCRELENCRLESSRQLQEQQLQREQAATAHGKQLEALRTELQFKTHELSEVTRQCRALRDSPGRSTGSPPRKAARLAGSPPAARRRFITSSEFRRAETGGARTEAVSTQTEPDSEQAELESDAVPACHLVSAVLAASGEGRWLGQEALSALAELADQPDCCAEQAGRATDLVAAAAAARLSQFPVSIQRLQEAAEADRRLCTLGSGRRRAAALLSMLREESEAATALAALRRLAEWRPPPLAARLTQLLPPLLRPAIVEGEVKNVLMMEYTAALLAAMADDKLPDSLLQALEPALHEVLNTKPPARLLSAVLELLISAAGTGQIGGLWCRAQRQPTAAPSQKHTGTCLVKKLSVLFSEWRRPGEEAEPPPAAPSYRLPASHSRQGAQFAPPAAAAAAAALRGQLEPEQLRSWRVSLPPAVDPSDGCRWLRLLSLVMTRPASLPTQPCCRGHLTLLVVQLLHSAVETEDVSEDPSAPLHLLSALRQLADLDPAFSGSVSRERLRYLVTMETLGRRWRQMALTAEHVGVLQDLYKFEPGTFDGAGSQPA